MNSSTPISTRPLIDLSEEERLSFDINDEDQVAAFVQEAIETIRPNSQDVDKIGVIVKGMLEEDFGPNVRKTNSPELTYREFVMAYVLNEENRNRATETYNKIVKGVEKLGRR